MEVRPSTRELLFDGKREVLEPRVMAVLIILARAKGDVVTRDDLTEACWAGRVVSDDAINRVISRVRRASDLTGGRDFALETITKVGYRLVAQPAADGAPAQPASKAPPASPGRPAILAAAAALAAAVMAVGAWWLFGREPAWTEDPTASRTLAVLPFDSLGATDDETLALGMSREIRNTLSRVRGLRVVSDASSFAIAAENLSAEQMGRRLNADYLLDGSLVRTGETVKLSAELVDGWSGVNLWTDSRSGPAADLEQLRQLISAAVFEQILARVGPTRLEVLAPPRRDNPQAYRLLVEAQQHLENTTAARMRNRAHEGLDDGDRANALIDQALAIEPDSPLGLRLKGQVISMAATRELFARNVSNAERAAAAADYYRRAIAADPDAVPALAALGEYYRRFEWRWDEAKALFERALALDPNHAEAHLSYAYYLSGTGRCEESLRHAQISIEIDPAFGWRTLGVPRSLKCLGRFEEADAAYLDALERDPGNLIVLREAYMAKLIRRDAAGLRELRRHVEQDLWKNSPPDDLRYWLAWTAIAADALEGGTARFRELISSDVAAYKDGSQLSGAVTGVSGRPTAEIKWYQSLEYASVGETELAIDMLEQAIAGGALYFPEALPYGAYEFTPEIRAHPRYQAIWRRDPRLVELVQLRLEAANAKQMATYLSGGVEAVPAKAPVDTRS
jgi:TolB-like protein/DNA-binding winged helix-turn-helix (wHTH) protein